MENKQSWVERNPKAVKKIKERYYLKNQEQAKLRSKRQNLRGKISYAILTNEQRKKVDKEVEKMLLT